MIGVEPLQAGIASFQTTFSSVVHFTGRFFSLLTPLSDGPRHCGQFCAAAFCSKKPSARKIPTRRMKIFSFMPRSFLTNADYSDLSAGSNGERRAAIVATSDAVAPETRIARSNRPNETFGP